MMGMAEGGEVQNPYMQQQLLYSQPKPVSMNEQNKAIVDSINPVENQMPIQNMAAGGQISGYQGAGDVTDQTGQNYVQAGQQALNRGFVGFPLGATIFPSEKTGQTVLGPTGTQVATTDAINTAATAFTTVTLYGPNGEIVVLTLPTDIDRYNKLLAEGYTTSMPGTTTTTTTTGGDDTTTTGGDDTTTSTLKGGKDDPIKETIGSDPSSWMDKFDYKDLNNLVDQTKNSLTKSPVFGVDSALGAFMNGTTAAQAAANIIILKANGGDPNFPESNPELVTKVKELELRWKQYVDNDILLKAMPEQFINGDKLAKEIVENNIDVALFKESKDAFGNNIFAEGTNEFEQFVAKVGPKSKGSEGAAEAFARVRERTKAAGVTPTGAPPLRPETVYDTATGKTIAAKPPAPKAPPVKTQAQKAAEAKSAVNDWVAATQATKGKKGIARHKAIKAQSEASKKATKAIREKTGRGFFKEGGLMTKGKKKK